MQNSTKITKPEQDELEDIIQTIQEKDYDRKAFVGKAILDPALRQSLVEMMTSHPHIMVYYHAYEVVLDASRERPDLFYPYWDPFAALLAHPNSYHRDFGLDLIGNLAAVDSENHFAGIAQEFYALVNDTKFMTACCHCLPNLKEIYIHKADQRGAILELLLDLENRCQFRDRQLALMQCEALNIFEVVYPPVSNEYRQKINAFIRVQTESGSPKTRRKARELAGKYGLK